MSQSSEIHAKSHRVHETIAADAKGAVERHAAYQRDAVAGMTRRLAPLAAAGVAVGEIGAAFEDARGECRDSEGA